MNGLYLHIPFCKQACHYCDFHFSTNQSYRHKLIEAIAKEMALRKKELGSEIPHLNSVYFGGGTPSILNAEDWEVLWESLNINFSIDVNAEITVEANPDDLSDDKLLILKNSPVNRLSIGIQSFRNEDLTWMNRAHKAEEALIAVDKAREYGFQHFSIDLIYGIPGLDNDAWIKNIETAVSLGINHLSAYCLTVESGTALHKFIEKGKYLNTDDRQGSEHYLILCEKLNEAGFNHYEISNFARPGHEAVHNSGYWNEMHYLGLGPSAHSFDGKKRSWNISNNHLYMKAIMEEKPMIETEESTAITQFNERLLTGLRRRKGINPSEIDLQFGIDLHKRNQKEIELFLSKKWLERIGNNLCPTDEGMLWSDYMASELFQT